MRVKEIQSFERPREKVITDGIACLSHRELLAVLLRTGYKKISALDLADTVLNSVETLGDLGKCNLDDLMQIKGIKFAKGIELLAAFELGRRIAFETIKQKKKIGSPQDLINWLSQQIGFEKQEHFVVLFLNQKNQVLHFKTMFVGTLTNASVHPREIYKEAMRVGCAKIICVHNHPSGDPRESQADVDITKSIEACGKIAAIPLLDHIIVSKNAFVSFRQKRLID